MFGIAPPPKLFGFGDIRSSRVDWRRKNEQILKTTKVINVQSDKGFQKIKNSKSCSTDVGFPYNVMASTQCQRFHATRARNEVVVDSGH